MTVTFGEGLGPIRRSHLYSLVLGICLVLLDSYVEGPRYIDSIRHDYTKSSFDGYKLIYLRSLGGGIMCPQPPMQSCNKYFPFWEPEKLENFLCDESIVYNSLYNIQ